MKQIILYIILATISFATVADHTTHQGRSEWYGNQDTRFSGVKHYKNDRAAFKCFNAWGDKLRGRFDRIEKQLIELGGGYCKRKFTKSYHGDLSIFNNTDIPKSMVINAIRQVKRDYHIRHAQVIKAKKLKIGSDNFKYLLVYHAPGYGKRKFKIKQNLWSGQVIKAREV